MLLTNRFGVTASSSSRVHKTALAGSASTFFEMKTRPTVVAAQALDVSAGVRSMEAVAPPARSPKAASSSGVGPSRSQSPHVEKLPGGIPVPVHSLQIVSASAMVRVPRPAVFVRYAVRPVPANSVLLTTGSLITGE